ncbi:MAG: metallophosphoesterase [Clostridia bacterium]|nr:metallophosphoesterase [Clostridia bacterium]
MVESNRMSKKGKIIAAVSVFLVLAIGLALVFLYGSMPMKVDWEKIHKVQNNVTLLAPGAEGNPSKDAYSLVKRNEDGSVDETDWKVMQATDLHFGDKMKENQVTLEKFLEAIYREKPDYVVLTGDIITSIRGRSRAVQLCNIFEKLGIYWTYVIGNHEGDQIFALSRKELIDICASYPHCVLDSSVKYTSDGKEVWGEGNCVVHLLGKDKVVQSMIFMDTGDAITDADAARVGVAKGTYDFLKEEQMQWYKEQVEAATLLDENVKTMLFIHIPLVEQGSLVYVKQAEYEPKDETVKRSVVLLSEEPNCPEASALTQKEKEALDAGEIIRVSVSDGKDGNRKVTLIPAAYKKVIGSERMLKDEVIGFYALKEGWAYADGTGCQEGCCSSDYNNGMYALMTSMREHVNGLFCGHDHVTNSVLFEAGTYTTEDSPVYLCYGICGGYATYSLYTKKMSEDPDELKGYSILRIHDDSSFDYVGVQYTDVEKQTEYIVNSLPVYAHS